MPTTNRGPKRVWRLLVVIWVILLSVTGMKVKATGTTLSGIGDRTLGDDYADESPEGATDLNKNQPRLVTDGGRNVDSDGDDGDLDREEHGGSEAFDNAETAEKLHIATQSTRRKLLLNIVSHPKQAPSVNELMFQNPSMSRSAVDKHLGELQDKGLVEKVSLEKGKRQRDLPHNFWIIPDPSREFLEKHELIPADPRPLQGAYARVKKPDKIQRYENAERPEKVTEGTDNGVRELEGLDQILHEYKETGDANKAGRKLSELEEDEAGTGDTSDTASSFQTLAEGEGILERLLMSVHRLETRVERIESKI